MPLCVLALTSLNFDYNIRQDLSNLDRTRWLASRFWFLPNLYVREKN